MFNFLSSRSPVKYSRIPHEDKLSSNFPDHTQSSSRRSSTWTTVFLLLCAVSIGYYAGSLTHPQYNSGLLGPMGTVEREFVYNRTYSTAPTNETIGAWRSLFPENGGFIHHPKLATNFSGIAVFHQLHCLHALYDIYYVTTTPDSEHNNNNNTDHPHPTKRMEHDHNDHAVHARHCFDYLRQTLMCHADTNLEPYNYELDGVTGWGVKMCRDYESVVRFAGEWGGNKWASDYPGEEGR